MISMQRFKADQITIFLLFLLGSLAATTFLVVLKVRVLKNVTEVIHASAETYLFEFSLRQYQNW